MRILFLDQFSTLGGGQQCLRDIVTGLVNRGCIAHVGLPGAGPLIRDMQNAGATVHRLPLNPYTDGSKTGGDVWCFATDMPRLALTIRGLMRQEAIDLVYVNGPRLLPATALATDRFIFHSHSLLLTAYAKQLAGLALRSRRAKVIASSQFVAGPLRRFLPPGKLQVIYNGVADCSMQAAPPNYEAPIVGIIGRVAPEKGHLDFLAAARVIREAGSNCRFMICGDGQHSGDTFLEIVRREAAGLPVEFVPWQSDVRPVLNRLSVLAVCSQSLDATPRVIPEALSAGVTVAAYRTGGIPELFDDASGALTAPGEPATLAQRILDLISDREGMRERRQHARRTYLERFTVDRYVQEIGTVLESELARFSKSPRIISPAESAANPASARTTR